MVALVPDLMMAAGLWTCRYLDFFLWNASYYWKCIRSKGGNAFLQVVSISEFVPFYLEQLEYQNANQIFFFVWLLKLCWKVVFVLFFILYTLLTEARSIIVRSVLSFCLSVCLSSSWEAWRLKWTATIKAVFVRVIVTCLAFYCLFSFPNLVKDSEAQDN